MMMVMMCLRMSVVFFHPSRHLCCTVDRALAYSTASQPLEDDFAARKLHPGDLKNGMISAINELLALIRAKFTTPEMQALIKSAYPDEPAVRAHDCHVDCLRAPSSHTTTEARWRSRCCRRGCCRRGCPGDERRACCGCHARARVGRCEPRRYPCGPHCERTETRRGRLAVRGGD
jgi:hypothetical protein